MLLAGAKSHGIHSTLPGRGLLKPATELRPWLRRPPTNHSGQALEAGLSLREVLRTVPTTGRGNLVASVEPARQEGAIDPFYLFACCVEWERHEDTGAAWELIAAAQSSHSDTRAHARALLATSPQLGAMIAAPAGDGLSRPKPNLHLEANVNSTYGLEMIEDSCECSSRQAGFYNGLSAPALRALHRVSHKSTLSAGTILFVEGQSSRGIFILCSGRVNLSTTSREGKVLILKTVEAGETLGLSAAISGVGYEVTAETSTPCQLNFVDRKHLLDLLHSHSEIGLNAVLSLSRDFQSAYRDIHDLVMTRSSAGKLARLLLSQSASSGRETVEVRISSSMTHEEMAHRIGASRETVTRLLSDLKRKQLIRLDGPTLVIRNRPALEALAV
jgi:CRP/FNR family transcriptional regulator, cyclic AMP receptor protein